MKRWGRIENNVIREIIEAPELPPFHPSLIWIELTSGQKLGDIVELPE